MYAPKLQMERVNIRGVPYAAGTLSYAATSAGSKRFVIRRLSHRKAGHQRL